jgi:hypothetical protein
MVLFILHKGQIIWGANTLPSCVGRALLSYRVLSLVLYICHYLLYSISPLSYFLSAAVLGVGVGSPSPAVSSGGGLPRLVGVAARVADMCLRVGLRAPVMASACMVGAGQVLEEALGLHSGIGEARFAGALEGAHAASIQPLEPRGIDDVLGIASGRGQLTTAGAGATLVGGVVEIMIVNIDDVRADAILPQSAAVDVVRARAAGRGPRQWAVDDGELFFTNVHSWVVGVHPVTVVCMHMN